MADFALIRNSLYTRTKIRGIYDHNERRKKTYRNVDIDLTRSNQNVHFKAPSGSYCQMLDELVAAGAISLRGLKSDAVVFDELLLDVNSAYFEDRGGYDFAKAFYEDAYCFCCEEVGEKNILSAVMHADERNCALSEERGKDIWHYHMHVVYLPVVEKVVRYTKRCGDPALVGTVKETISQVSHSKRWKSEPVLGTDGKPLRDEKGKVILAPSYGALQTRFAEYMQTHGYTDVERGVVGKRAKHKSIIEYKLEQDVARAKAAATKANQLEQISLQLATEISTQQKILTDLKDLDEYIEEVSNCRTLLQQVFDVVAAFLSRSRMLRDRKTEKTFGESLRRKLIEFFSRIRNLLGFELVSGMAPEQCQSPKLAEEGERLALELRIAEAKRRAESADSVAAPQRKEHVR